MTNYSKTTNFTAKDSLVSGDANKIVKGSEIDAEFDNIATASATKANIASPVFTGVVSFPDGSAGDPSITNTGDTNTGLFFSAADTLSFTAAGTAQFTMGDGVIAPVTDNDIDLGTSSLKFKDGYFDGTVYADAINFNGTAITATAAELNIMDGVTSTAAELNILDGKAFLDEDDMSSNSATGIASQQSIKAYVDAQITAEDLDFQADSGGALSIDLDSETLTFTGGTGVDTSGSGNAVTFAIDSTVATLTGTQTLTNKTLTSPTLNTPTIGTSFTIGSATITEAELEILDGATVTTAELNVLDGITSTTAELNILDGVTSTAAELNILDGVTATTAEINYVDGVTSNVQTQLDAKAPIASPTFTGTVTVPGLTSSSTVKVDHTGALTNAIQLGDHATIGNDTGIYFRTTGVAKLAIPSSGNILFSDTGTASLLNISGSGDISFYEDTGTTPKFFWDASAESLGIGTTSPSEKLTIAGDVQIGESSGGEKLKFVGSSSKYNFLVGKQVNVDNAFEITPSTAAGGTTFSTPAVVVNSSGLVGIGTSAPTSPLHVKSATDVNVRFDDSGSSSYTWYMNDAQNLYIPNVQLASTHTFYATGQRKVDIDSAGNLLVGKSSSAINTDGVELLNSGRMFLTTTSLAHVIRRKSTDGALVEFQKDGTTVGSIESRAGLVTTLILDPRSSGAGISGGGAFIYPTNNVGALSNDVCSLGASTNRFKDLYLSGQWVSNGSNNTVRASFQVSGTQYGYINVATTGTLYSTSSDYRLKENIVPLTNATERLKQLNPLRFNFIPDETNTVVDGFLAHEVQSVVPEAIHGTHNEVDDNGNPVYQGIDQSKLVPLLVATIQELEARIAALESN